MPLDEELGRASADKPQNQDDDINSVLVFFDELMMQQVDIGTLVRRTAEKIAGRADVQSADGRCFASGSLSLGAHPLMLRRDLPNGHQVRLEFPASRGGLQVTFLDRFAVAASVALAQEDGWLDLTGDAAVDGILSQSVGRLDRSRMLRAIGLPHDAPVRLVAVAGPEKAREAMAIRLVKAAEWARAVIVGNLTAVLVRDPFPLIGEVPIDVHLGIGSACTASEAPRGWVEACLALRFSLPSTRESGTYSSIEAVAIPWDEIGCFRILPQFLTAEQMGQDPDVQALDRLASEGGEVILQILESVAATDSLRKAAQHVFLHHNSVASRVEKAEAVLGFSVTDPYGRSRLLLALTLRRLRESATTFLP